MSRLRFVLSGGSDNTDPANSLGGPPSETAAGELFSNIGPDDAATGSVELRCVYLVADGGPIEFPRVWFGDTPDRTVLEVGVDFGGKNAIAAPVEPGTDPVGVTFSRPDDYLTGLALPGEPYDDGDRVALWLRRLSPSEAKAGKESFSLRARGLTAG